MSGIGRTGFEGNYLLFNNICQYCSKGPGIDTKGINSVGRMQVKQPMIRLFLKEFCQLIFLYFIYTSMYSIYISIFYIYFYLYIYLCIYVYLYIYVYFYIYTYGILIKIQCYIANVKNPIPNELRTTEE